MSTWSYSLFYTIKKIFQIYTIVLTMVNDPRWYLKWYVNYFNIFEYEENEKEYWNNREMTSKNLVENNEIKKRKFKKWRRERNHKKEKRRE